MSVYIGDVQTFAGVIADKPQVLKVIEESAEVFSAWERLRVFDSDEVKGRLVEEIADTIQACANLLAALDVDDMRQPMQVCYVRNKERGREYSNDAFSAENDVKPQSVDASDANADSRDQLVVDIGLFVARYMPKEDSPKMFEAVCSFLDRQAAITAIEVARERYDFERGLITARDELQEALNVATGKWAKADAENRELQAENEGLKARIESLRTKLSKMLDAASEIQHIGDLP